MKSCSNREAFQYYRDALAILKEEPDTPENKRELLDVILLMTIPMYYLFYPEDSLAVLQEGVRLCEGLGDRKSLATLYGFIGLFYAYSRNPALGRQYEEDAFREAERIGDVDTMARVATNLCQSYATDGSYAKIGDVAPRVIALLEKTHREHESFGLQMNPYSALQVMHGACLGALGKFADGERLCERASPSPVKSVTFSASPSQSSVTGCSSFTRETGKTR